MLSAQFGNRPEIQRPQRAGLDADRLFPVGNALVAAVTLGHMAFVGIILRRAVRTGHMAVTAANAHLFVDHHKTVFALVHRSARADLGAGRIGAVVTGDGEVIGENVLIPDAVILLPVAAGIFINAAEADIRQE